jgi:putative SOS response-associated peptidase YedK
MEPSNDVYPDRFATIVRNPGNGERQLAGIRWGMPIPSRRYQAALKRADKLRAKGKPVNFC